MQRRNKIRLALAGTLAVVATGGAAVFATAHRGPQQPDMAIDAGMRTQLVDAVIAAITRDYVDPQQAAKMSARLREQLRRGDFDGLTRADAFADALTDSLRHDTHDRHLEVGYSADAVPDTKPGEPDSPAEAAAFLAERRRFNFGFENVGRLPCDIGLIELHEFGRPEQVKSRVEAAMTLLADTRALIVDLRRMHGGDPNTVMLFASYFYDRPTHLNDLWFRDENRLQERWTTAVAGARYGEARPVYILTSEETFSAGEDFAYALKNNGRAVLVGETTGGGAHPGNLHRLGPHFLMNVPSGRTISPVTKTDWEGIGVAPDVKTSAKKALDVAQLAILKKLLAVETDPEWQRKMRERVGELD